ncbi:protein Shroom isoform X2 [Armigeres subalbatus]|uniref:protein Shroom isoform X2 n=1 Tax=Armigeres subalbatus TaxID=124917 RepID=UPI002ED547FE
MDRFSVSNNGSGSAVAGGTPTSAAQLNVNSGANNATSIAASSNNNSNNNSNNAIPTATVAVANNSPINNNSNSNNGVKLRPDRGNSSIDSTLSSASAAAAVSGVVASSYRRSFHHRLGPGSASATSDYSMSTLAESIQDEQHPGSNGSGSTHGPSGPTANHNTPGLPGMLPNNSNLTQAGLEEYSRSYYEQTVQMYHHQKQSSYAQSEGYHSYVSSSDSSSTPFLDRLRQDSELLLSSRNWSQQDLQQLSSSNNSIADNNSSESTSSTETLKWLGSMSDVSEASHATSMSALSSAGSSSQLIAHSSRVRTPQRHNSESILFMTSDEQQQPQHLLLHQHQTLLGGGINSHPVSSSVSMGSLLQHHHHPHHLSNGIQQQQQQQSSPTSSSAGGSPVGEDLRFQHRTASNASLASSNGTGSSVSISNSVRSSRSNNRLFPISTYTEIPSSNGGSGNALNNSSISNSNSSSSNNQTSSQPATPSGMTTSLADGSKQLSPHNWQSVAERINELEKHQQQNLSMLSNSGTGSSNNVHINPSKNLSQHPAVSAASTAAQPKPVHQNLPKYTYFDPSKTHRVSNPSLKAFQKNAVISYFERQQAYARESNHNLSRPTTLNLNQPSGSPPSLKSASQRSSISSAYSSSGSTMDLTPASQSPIVGNYHHHPSIVVQQQLDKIAANNLRNQLASVQTMNLLNKVQSSSPSQPSSAQLIESPMISNATLILGTNGAPIDQQTLDDLHHLDANGSPPPPPPRSRSIGMPGLNSSAAMSTAAATHAAHLATVRRTSSASEYSSIRDKMVQQRQQLSKDLLGPMIMGPIIALDDWVPERPPKNPMLRIPSPELPPPPPMMSPTEDVILLNQDEPLPPPPPEILRHIRQLSDSGEPKSQTASRRNSFAGQTNKKSLYRASTVENLSPPPPGAPPPQSQITQLIIPPAVPKKPQSMEPQVIYRRPSSSMAKSQPPPLSNTLHQAHRVVLNGKPDQRHSLPMPLQSSPQLLHQPQFVPRQSDSRVSMRKRSHNSQQIPVAEYLLKAAAAVAVAHHQNQNNGGPMVPGSPGSGPTGGLGGINNHKGALAMTTPPPPLKPRLSLQMQPQQQPQHPLSPLQDLQNGPLFSMGSKRSNSKASYLPRQPRDKLHSDPDHGSYKLTLTSNEDSINHNDVFTEDIISPSPKCNLPDVLPPGVKYSLYSNNNNNTINSNNNNNSSSPTGANGKQSIGVAGGKSPKSISHSAPIISTNSLKSMFNFTPQQTQQNQVTPPSASSPVTPSPPPAYTPSGSPTNQAISPKYTSQSTFDLKKTQILDTKYLNQAQIGLPSPATVPCNESVNNTNYLNHPAVGGCGQQTVNNCIENSEISDCFETSITSTGTITVAEPAPVEANQNGGTNTTTSTKLDAFSAPEAEEDSSISSSNNTSICAEANQSSVVDSIAEEPIPTVALERVTKEINLDPVVVVESPVPTKVVQRTEIVLRVGAPTSEASSQTDDEPTESSVALIVPRSSSTTSAPSNGSNSSITHGIAELVLDQHGGGGITSSSTSKHSVGTSTGPSPPGTPTAAKAPGSFFSKACTAAPRKVHPEEIDCDKLSHDLISQLSPSDKLHTILAPKTFKSSSDYVSDLFNIQIAPRPMKKDASTTTPEVSPQKSPLDILTTSSTYFQVSEPKAKLMTRYSREMTLINGDCCDLTKKKEELVQRLGKKLLVLSNEQTSIAEESNANDLLGNDVALKVAQKVRPSDASKFRSYVDDVGYITMLLLSLSGRLARTDNALHCIVDESHPDKKILEAKRDRLLEQLDEAKQLKDDIDRRGAIISKILEKALTIEEYADYDYFINMKAKLIVDSREIADKIKLGEEQLAALKDTLVQSEC